MSKESNETNWTEVAAKAQAYGALHLAGLGEATVADKAKFLMIFGLSRADVAALINSTEESVRKSLDRASKQPKSSEQPNGQ
jgi:hypothetical protein